MNSNGQPEKEGKETLDEALAIVNGQDPSASDKDKEAEATEEVAAALGDLA